MKLDNNDQTPLSLYIQSLDDSTEYTEELDITAIPAKLSGIAYALEDVVKNVFSSKDSNYHGSRFLFDKTDDGREAKVNKSLKAHGSIAVMNFAVTSPTGVGADIGDSIEGLLTIVNELKGIIKDAVKPAHRIATGIATDETFAKKIWSVESIAYYDMDTLEALFNKSYNTKHDRSTNAKYSKLYGDADDYGKAIKSLNKLKSALRKIFRLNLSIKVERLSATIDEFESSDNANMVIRSSNKKLVKAFFVRMSVLARAVQMVSMLISVTQTIDTAMIANTDGLYNATK